METEISSVNWREPYSVVSTPLIFDISSEINYEKHIYSKEVRNIKPTQSFLHSQKLKQSLFESKKAFLNQSLNDQKPEDEQMEEKSIVLGQPDQKKIPVKKISFKVKKQSSLYRKSAHNVRGPLFNSNKVAELTKKFNEMVEQNNSLEHSHSFKKLVKRVNSINSDKEIGVIKSKESLKVSRKPSVKTKKTMFDHTNLIIKKTKPTVDRKPSLNKKQSGEKLVRAKIGDIEQCLDHSSSRPTTLNLNLNIPTHIIETSPNGTSVRAAIEIFEKKSVNSSPNRTIAQKESPTIVPKPKVPEKPLTVKTSGKTALQITFNSKKLVDETEKCDKFLNRIVQDSSKKFDKTDEDTVVQIINIPAVLPQRRCDSMYETLNLRKITPENLNVKAKSEESIVQHEKSSIRSSIAPNSSFLWRERCASAYNPVLIPSKAFEIEQEKQKPPDVPPRPLNTLTRKSLEPPKILKRKMPLPEDSAIQTHDQEVDSKDYEEIFPRSASPFSKMGGSNASDEKNKGYEEISTNDEIVKLNNTTSENKDDGYEPVGETPEDPNDGYEYCSSPKTENIYETLPAHQVLLRRQQQEPLPPRPPSSCIAKNDEQVSNCYESIYNFRSKKFEYENNYESIYCSNLTDSGSNRDSLLSADQKSNSLYGKAVSSWDEGSSTYKAPSDLSSSDRSEDWVDVTDNEEAGNRIVIVREKQKSKKSGWSQHLREQWSKTQIIPPEGADSDSDHHYESLYTATKEDEYQPDDYDSFDSDSESEHSFYKDDTELDIPHNRLPDPPNSQPYGLMKFAGKHMKILKKNIAKDFSKSLRRMTKRISKSDMEFTGVLSTKNPDNKRPPPVPPKIKHFNPSIQNSSDTTYQNVELPKNTAPLESSSADDQEKSKSLPRKNDFWNKFRRSMSISAESANELTSQLSSSKAKSTFYLTETIYVDEPEVAEEALPDSEVSLSPVFRHPNKVAVLRPQSPPPPAPVSQNQSSKPVNKKERKSSSWYAEAGLFRNSENNQSKRPNTCWYAEVGLYQPPKNSPPSTSSGENSGSTTSSPIRPLYFINQDNKEEINNMKNDSNNLYGGSMNSFSSLETKKDESLKNVIQEIQLRLQDEPLYQFYDAAVLESACYDSTSEFDSDNYEDVPSENDTSIKLSVRPTAMELVSPKRNSICFNRTLWCEIPEVINSSVLSTLSPNQKKLQEAKFEILTSEASYLNSLNVLRNHFVKSLELCEYITKEEQDVLFGKIKDVTHSSERLLLDLEKCWQDNILLHGVCDIVQKHAEENFSVYVPYCENQVILDDTLKELKERPGFNHFLRQLESSTTCQSLSLYSFLMLPMQRITRWPLLIDAVLKRIDQQDLEYYTCQYALATLNKIVNQCNEAARVKERENELKKISNQLEFLKGTPSISLMSPNRWLIRSGPVTHIQPRSEDGKLTFGRRFTKATLHLYLFNDLLCITREKGENLYLVMHFCPRNMIEISSDEEKNFLLLTVLENQNGKTVNLMLSCGSDSDKERWLEALTPPTSEDPEETLYDYWDCPQVTAIHSYVASQPDELSLTKGDAVNVLRKMRDGWYHGERIRDGHTGWFPANHTVEVLNPHVRARNLKQRNRLLAFSEHYLKSK